MTGERGTVFLMYHELELDHRPLCQNLPGYVRYIVPLAGFRAQMQSLQTMQLPGVSVSEALVSPQAHAVAITFDDGCETDLIAAAPLLRELNFHATFYITVGFLDRPGYLSRSQLRALSDLGFEIGSHSMSHSYITDLDDSKLWREVAASKQELERTIGRSVVHFSCPGGRWDRRIVEAARKAGYHSLATSRAKTNRSSGDPFALGRVAILRDTSLRSFQALAQGRGLRSSAFWASGRGAIRNLLGNTIYDRLRDRLLAGKDR